MTPKKYFFGGIIRLNGLLSKSNGVIIFDHHRRPSENALKNYSELQK
nr:MAG TPA: hypothetical protein [Caudoviricetes sp.]